MKFEEILLTVTANTKESIDERERLMKVKIRVPKFEVNEANKYWRNTFKILIR